MVTMPLSVVVLLLAWHDGVLFSTEISARSSLQNNCAVSLEVVVNAPLSDSAAGIPGEIRHEVVRRGNHPAELEAAEYVVAGTFSAEGNAKRFSEGLRSLDYPARIGYLTEKSLWYVYLYKSTSAEQVRDRQSRFAKLFLLRDAWWLTVVQ